MEDIDAAFLRGINRETADREEPATEASQQTTNASPKSGSKERSTAITLSGLLNALDGVDAQEGRILFATTNKYTNLDPALCRPGRMDLHIEFKHASKYQAMQLFKRFFMPVNRSNPNATPANEDKESDSGYGSTVDDEEPSIEPTPSTSPTSSCESHQDQQQKASLLRLSQELAPSQISALANKFADAIPEEEFSVASLQGFLMSYKSCPLNAIEGVREWVANEQRKKRERSGVAASIPKAKASDANATVPEAGSD
jgi:chaperone BCS1